MTQLEHSGSACHGLSKPLRHARQPHTATIGETTHRPKSSPEGIQRYEAFDAKGEEEKEAEEDDEEAHERGAPWSEEPPVPPGLADEKEARIEHKRPLLLLLLLGLLHLRPLLLLL